MYANCLNCNRYMVIRARGLCRTCHRSGDIRHQYARIHPLVNDELGWCDCVTPDPDPNGECAQCLRLVHPTPGWHDANKPRYPRTARHPARINATPTPHQPDDGAA